MPATLEKAHEQLEQGHAAGYDSFNVKIGPPQTPAYDRELIRAVRDFAPKGFHGPMPTPTTTSPRRATWRGASRMPASRAFESAAAADLTATTRSCGARARCRS